MVVGEWKFGGVIIGFGILGGGCLIINLRGVCFGFFGICCRKLFELVSFFFRFFSFIVFIGWGFFIKRFGGRRFWRGIVCIIELFWKDKKRWVLEYSFGIEFIWVLKVICIWFGFELYVLC